MMALSKEKPSCPTCPLRDKNIDFRNDDQLHLKFQEFIKKPFDPKKGKKNMSFFEPKFQRICQNLKLHLGSNTVETDIFKGIKDIMKRDFQRILESGKIQIFIPQMFLSKFPEIIQYDTYIEKIAELQVIQNINELTKKVANEEDDDKKNKMKKSLEENQQKMENNKFYTELRELNQREIEMVKSIQRVRGERAEKKMFKALQKYFSSRKEEVLVMYNFNFMGSVLEKDFEPSEKDFILINLTKRYIMPLEVKTTFHVNSLIKAIKQIEGTMKLTNDWVGGDLTEECGWIFIPATYFESEIDKFEYLGQIALKILGSSSELLTLVVDPCNIH